MMRDSVFFSGQEIEADLCIVGGGPAGIAIALALQSIGKRVLILESGGLLRSATTEALNDGESTRPKIHAPPSLYRARVLGGASSIWGGRCAPMDAIDFEQRDWVPKSGWPITHQDVWDYIPSAMSLLEAGEADFTERALQDVAPWIEGFADDDVQTMLERFSAPTHLGRRYHNELEAAPNIDVLLGATCIELEPDESGQTIVRAKCSNRNGGRFTIRCSRYVLAAGGLENTRVMLASRSANPRGLGNDYDLVGRYYMCHIEATVGELILHPNRRHVAWGFEMTKDKIYARRKLQVKTEIQSRERMLNAIGRLHYPYAADPRHNDAILSLMYLTKMYLIPEFRRKIAFVDLARQTLLDRGRLHYFHHILNIVSNAPRVATFLSHWIVQRHLRYRRIPHVVLRSSTGRYPLDFNGEQSPNFDSRISLAREVDAMGVPRIKVDWRITQLDIDSAVATFKVWQRSLQRSGVGTFQIEHESLRDVLEQAVPMGGHHIGTTRMAADPQNGVVDAHCKVHGIDNLYIAGSSVFATSGHANPTLTVVALALRLADHLKSKMA